uniref:Uncharacterized protein n=1 Tax=Cucumis sativus TaxID=3659 RepID=A0A0A0LDH2_CUCSA
MDGVEGQSGFLVTSVFNLTNANGVCNEELGLVPKGFFSVKSLYHLTINLNEVKNASTMRVLQNKRC